MSDRQKLLDMGFEAQRIEWALKAIKNSGLQAAMEHILENAEKPVPNFISEGVDGEDEEASKVDIEKLEGSVNDSDLVAKSIKCSQCGKIFRTEATASFHAEKSGHDQFEESTDEIKPLTEEEKKAKLNELKEKLAIKRAAQAKEDEKSNKANDAIRRKAGQDVNKIREDLKIKEVQKEAERKKREKIEDQKVRAAIKAQIEADKRERAEKAAREKALRENKDVSSQATSVVIPKPGASAVKSSDSPETRLQIRLSTGGPPLTKTFPSNSTLVDVAEWVASENLAYNVDTVKFAMTFPRKHFSPEEMPKTLKENGLTPSAVLMAS
ncbi:hypothetical protein L204_102907 [Cryptococcus depauperatus]